MTKIMYSKTLPELKIINKLPKNSKEKIVSRNYIEYKTLTNQNSTKSSIFRNSTIDKQITVQSILNNHFIQNIPYQNQNVCFQTIKTETTNNTRSSFKNKNNKLKLICFKTKSFSSADIPSRKLFPRKVEDFIKADLDIKNQIKEKIYNTKRSNSILAQNDTKRITYSNSGYIQKDIETINRLDPKKYLEIIRSQVTKSKNVSKSLDFNLDLFAKNDKKNISQNFLHAQSPILEINDNLCFPNIIKDKDLLFSIWKENMEKLKLKNGYFNKVNSLFDLRKIK